MTLQIGDTAPDFEAETTQGRISLHDWIGGSVSDEEARQMYPHGWTVPRPYIRIVPQPS